MPDICVLLFASLYITSCGLLGLYEEVKSPFKTFGGKDDVGYELFQNCSNSWG